MYVEKQASPDLHEHILKHLPRMQYWHEWQGCELVYLPLHKLDSVEWKTVSEYLTYQFPILNRPEFSEVLGTLREPAHMLVNRLLINTHLADAEGEAFLIYTDTDLQRSESHYTILSSYTRGSTTVEGFFTEGFNRLWDIQSGLVLYDPEISDDISAHDLELPLAFEAQTALPEEQEPILAEEVISRLDRLREAGGKSSMLDILVYLLNNLSPNLVADRNAVLEMLQKHWADYAVARTPSRLFIDRHTRIFLTDFGNMEIEMRPLPKTLFLFYLRHPEGIAFPFLSDHEQELQQIYSRISNRSDSAEISRSIRSLIDPLDNSVNEKCARIKGAFTGRMHESIAAPYLISGPRGGVKRIALDRALLTYEIEALQACRE